MALKDTINRVRHAMRTGQYVNEAAVSTGVVLPILQDLGWPVFDPMVVAPEFTVGGRRVDFALCHPRTKPAVFIEVKQPGRSEGADRQLFEYAFHLGIPLAVLTDGREWHFYLPAGQGQYQERRVYKLDLIDRDIEESDARITRYLEYSAVVSGEAQRAAHDDYANLRKDREIATSIPVAWRKLLDEKDELLVDLVADQVESLCGYKPSPDMITEFLAAQVRPASLDTPQTSTFRGLPERTPQSESKNAQGAAPDEVPVGFSVCGQHISTRNARDTLIRFFEEMARRDPTFLERFAALPRHGRSRRFVAASKSELYPGRADLATEYSHELLPGWWIGTNYGAAQIRKIIEMACDVANLRIGKDVHVNV